MNLPDSEGIRAAAAAQLVSACSKYGLEEITKTMILELANTTELDLYGEMYLDRSAEAEPVCRQMLKLLEVPAGCVIGPIPYAAFEAMVKTAGLPSAARQTWIVIVEVKPHAIAAEEPTSPAPQLAPDCPATGEQPWEAMGRAFEAAATAEGTAPDTAADAVHTDVPRVLRPHHFVVAWRRAEDSQHAPSLNPHTDFRTHGQPSPVVHNVPMPHTPGLPEGASFEVFHPQ